MNPCQVSLIPTHSGRWTRFKFVYDGQHMGECQIVLNEGCRDYKNTSTISSIWGVEIYPPYKRQGHSKQLMKEVLHFISHQAPGRVWLWVKQDNIPAVRAYEATGFKVARKHNRAGDFEMETSVEKCECTI